MGEMHIFTRKHLHLWLNSYVVLCQIHGQIVQNLAGSRKSTVHDVVMDDNYEVGEG
jgi:hypothetical protein